jgi:hypothetical protein
MKLKLKAKIIAIGEEKDGFYSATAELNVTERKLADGSIINQSELMDVSARQPFSMGNKILVGSLTSRKKGASLPKDFNFYVIEAVDDFE